MPPYMTTQSSLLSIVRMMGCTRTPQLGPHWPHCQGEYLNCSRLTPDRDEGDAALCSPLARPSGVSDHPCRRTSTLRARLYVYTLYAKKPSKGLLSQGVLAFGVLRQDYQTTIKLLEDVQLYLVRHKPVSKLITKTAIIERRPSKFGLGHLRS
jgi:hypothetical protein